MSFNFGLKRFDELYGEEDAVCELKTVDLPEEITDMTLNLDVPLYEEYPTTIVNDEPAVSLNVIEPAEVSPSTDPQSCTSGEQNVKSKSPRFKLVYGYPSQGTKKSSKKLCLDGNEPSTSTVKNVVTQQGDIYHPYMNGNRLQSRKTSRRTEKTAFTYPNMAYLALLNAPNKQAYVSDIYEFMLFNFPYFATAPNSWKNVVRNNLANSGKFEKVKDQHHISKGDMWRVKDDSNTKLMEDVNKVIRKNTLEDLKLKNAKDLNDIVNGQAGIKLVGIPVSVHNPMVQYPTMNQIPTYQHIPFYPPIGFAPMPLRMFLNFQQQPLFFNQ